MWLLQRWHGPLPPLSCFVAPLFKCGNAVSQRRNVFHDRCGWSLGVILGWAGFSDCLKRLLTNGRFGTGGGYSIKGREPAAVGRYVTAGKKKQQYTNNKELNVNLLCNFTCKNPFTEDKPEARHTAFEKNSAAAKFLFNLVACRTHLTFEKVELKMTLQTRRLASFSFVFPDCMNWKYG